MKRRIVPLSSFFALITFFVIILSPVFADAAPEWIYYDNGNPENPSSSFPFQGVRFSLPDDVVTTPLLTIRFYFSCPDVCPVTVHITGHDHKTDISAPINYNAGNSWNDIDVSGYNIALPHNFYIILENHSPGSPVIDEENSVGRSFKGNFPESMTTHLSHNLLIRAETGTPIEVPVLKEWDTTITETIKSKIKGYKAVTQKTAYAEKWTMYADGSFATENNLYGLWKQKGKKVVIMLDPEDIIHMLDEKLYDNIEKTIVTKANLYWKEKKGGKMQGVNSMSAGAYFEDYEAVGYVTVKWKFTGMP